MKKLIALPLILGMSENNNVFYLAIEHPVPLIPNIKVQHTAITSEGTATTRGFSLDSITFDAETEATTELDLTHTDLTLYFEILDNYLSLDVGLTARQFDGLARVQGVSGGESSTEEVDLDLTIPLLYGKAQIDLPFTGWFVGGTINYLSISDNTVSDIEAKIGYLNGGLGLDFGFEAGLRRMTVETDDEGDLTADATISGPYAEVIFHF